MRALDATLTDGDRPAPGAALGRAIMPAGTRLGRYTLLRELGHGAFGQVHEAYDDELQRKVALKILRGRSSEHKALMLAEARALARASHPNLVSVLDVAEIDGRVVMAMELIVGRTLLKWVTDEQPPWTRVVDTVAAVSDGLSAAHAAGLIHRDIKPANVLIEDGGRPVVVDFGIAVAASRDDADGGRGPSDPSPEETPVPSTLPTSAAGTPPYMAPEQMRGERVDARVDQYALAVTLAELLTGQRPFGARDLGELLKQKDAEPSLELGRGRPQQLAQILKRAMAPRPEARFTFLSGFSEALRDVVQLHQNERRVTRVVLAGAAFFAVIGAISILSVAPLTGVAVVAICAAAIGIMGASRWLDGRGVPLRQRGLLLAPLATSFPVGLLVATALDADAVQAFSVWSAPISWCIFIMVSTLFGAPRLTFALGVEAALLLLGFRALITVDPSTSLVTSTTSVLFRASMLIGFAGIAALVARVVGQRTANL